MNHERMLEHKEYLPENIVLVETPKANFRILYGFHIKEQNPEEIGKADALIIETGPEPYSTPEAAEKTFNWARETIQYKRILEKARDEKRPIFFADIGEAEVVLFLQIVLGAIEASAGVTLLVLLAKEISDKQDWTRRKFLTQSIKGLAGLYFFSHMAKIISDWIVGGKINEKSAAQAVGRFLVDLNEKIHPETALIILTLRNHLLAQKMKTIAQTFSPENRKTEVAIVVGVAHQGMESALKKEDKERTELIDKLLRVPGMKAARERIATIARMDFDAEKNKWVVTSIFKDPHLAPLEKK